MKCVDYDKRHDILFVRWADDEYSYSEEKGQGVLLDFNEDGQIIGVEINGFSRKQSMKDDAYVATGEGDGK